MGNNNLAEQLATHRSSAYYTKGRFHRLGLS